MVYDILARVEKEDRRVMLNKKQALELEPLLNEEVLKGGGYYAEYRTDDARLTIELIKTARSYGAMAINYCSARDFTYEKEEVNGAMVRDELTGEDFRIQAKKVVSAAGPWVDRLRHLDGSLNGKRLHLTKGVHLVFPHDKFPLKHTTYFDAPDGRMIFAIPRGRITYVGTTDTTYKGSLDRVVATKADAEYLLKVVTHAFPDIQLQESDILSNWAGLRPLIHEDGKSPSELSRKDEIFISPQGLISIAGGKLTGYRKMAQRIVDLVFKKLKLPFVDCTTEKIPLSPEPIANAKAVEALIKTMEDKVSALGLDKYFAWYLVTNYGKQGEEILAQMKNYKEADIEVAFGRAEAWFCVHKEMVVRAEDFFVRRSGRLYFEINSIAKIKDVVLEDLKNELGWDEERLQKETQELEELVYDATHYYDKELV